MPEVLPPCDQAAPKDSLSSMSPNEANADLLSSLQMSKSDKRR
jgi:hypothetical protein